MKGLCRANTSLLKRAASWLTMVTLVVAALGCSPYYTDITNDVLENAAKEEWNPVPLESVVGSEDTFKGERVRLYIKRSNYEPGTSIVVVERIDSTFVYAWSQMSGSSRRQLSKIKLRRIAQFEVYDSKAAQGTAYGLWTLAWPVAEAFAGAMGSGWGN